MAENDEKLLKTQNFYLAKFLRYWDIQLKDFQRVTPEYGRGRTQITFVFPGTERVRELERLYRLGDAKLPEGVTIADDKRHHDALKGIIHSTS